MTELFPMFLKLEGRRCLIVGAGPIAESKMESLVRCGAKVRVVAPTATDTIREAARDGKIEWMARAYEPADLDGVFLVVAATPFPDLHQEIFDLARQEGILCNAVDEPERCDFYYSSVVRRGALQIAVSTSGYSPFLAQRLRETLERQFGPAYEPWTAELGRARSELFARKIAPEERRAALQELASDRAFHDFCALEATRVVGESQRPEPERMSGKVYFVGAGPGDPELLTRKAWRILREAEVILHDALVSAEILALAPERATLCSVGKRCGKKSITQEEIHALLIGYASSGRNVVRLQGGDPMIFGRAAEEIGALQEAGIEFEIVPGVTAAFACAAAAGVSLTDRRLASKVIFLSAHRRAGEFEQDLRTLPVSGATLAIYMPGSDYGRVVRELALAGFAKDTACLIVSQASTPNQSVLRTMLGALADVAVGTAPALLIVGAVAAAPKIRVPLVAVRDAAKEAE